MKQKTFIVIPSYNEERRIEEVIKGVLKFTQNIIVVDDGSKDGTINVLKKYRLTLLKHKTNQGKGAAMRTGVKTAIKFGATSIIFLDADGQHNPDNLPKFINELAKGNDIVFGSRNLRKGMPFARSIGNKIASKIVEILFNIKRNDLLCGFFGFNISIFPKISWFSQRYGVETEIVARVGMNKLKYKEIPIETIYLNRFKGIKAIDALRILGDIPGWYLEKIKNKHV